MATNKDLIKTAVALAATIEADISTEGLNNAQLKELVADLKAKQPSAGDDGDDDGAEAEPTKAYTVKKGKSITTKTDIRDGGEPICAGDLCGGQETLDDLVDKGYVVAPSK